MDYLYGKFTFLCVPKINGFALTLLKHVFMGLLCIFGQCCLKQQYETFPKEKTKVMTDHLASHFSRNTQKGIRV